LRSHENIAEANVFAINIDGMDKYICAWIKLKNKADKTTTEESIRAFCLKHLHSKRSPDFIKIVNEFPIGATGKVSKTELAQLYKKELNL
jgi:fatty-acyl-CoA synthase